MPNLYTNQDIQITDDGDLVLSSGGDFQVASIDQTTKQDAIINLYTVMGDFGAFPFLGSRVLDFIGEPNSRQNAGLLSNEIGRALTANRRFFPEDVTIKVVPVDIDSVATYVTIRNLASSGAQTIVFDFNYIKGLSLLSQSET